MSSSCILTYAYVAIAAVTISAPGTGAQGARATTAVQYLSGTGSDSTVTWDFRVSGGRKAGVWSTIPVPSNWEMQGFGTYKYSDDWSKSPAPDSVGEYRHPFRVPADWRGKRVSATQDCAPLSTDLLTRKLLPLVVPSTARTQGGRVLLG